MTDNPAFMEDIQIAMTSAPELMSELGITVDDLPNAEIGSGYYARAMRLPNGMILKLTTDRDDAEAAALIRDAGAVPGLVQVQDVWRIEKTVRATDVLNGTWIRVPGREPLYAIIAEPLTPLAGRAGLYKGVKGVFDAAEAGKLLFRLAKDYGSGLPEMVGAYPSVQEFLESMGLELSTPAAQRYFEDVLSGWLWLSQRGYDVVDLHSRNFGLNVQDQLVMFDFGHMSARDVGTAEIPVAANPAVTYRPVWRNREWLVMEARIGARRVGHLSVLQVTPHWFDVSAIEVKATHRRKGIGSELYRRANEEVCAKTSTSGIRSEGYQRGSEAEAVWKHLLDEGVAVRAEADREYRRGRAHDYQMPCDLNANPGSKVDRVFDEAFDVIEKRFPDFGAAELHEDDRAGQDGGAGADRQYAYCKAGDPIVIAFAPKAEQLPMTNLRALMRHEFGHALEYRFGVRELESRLGRRLPPQVERRADVIAEAVWGDRIRYDDRDIQCVGCKSGESPRPARLPDEKAKLKANAGAQYAYHATVAELLPSIAKEGLLPYEHEMLDEPGIFVEDDEGEAENYLERGSGALLRFRLVHMEALDYYSEDLPEYIWFDRVPPERLEYRLADGTWDSLLKLKANVATSSGHVEEHRTSDGYVLLDWLPGIPGYGGIADEDKSFREARVGVGAYLIASFLGNDLQVEYIEVDSDFQRQGVATLLYERALALARERAGTLLSDSRLEAEARAFWEKMVAAGLAKQRREGRVSYYAMLPGATLLPNAAIRYLEPNPPRGWVK